MMNVPVQIVPNQEFTISLDDNTWDISLKMVNGTIVVTLIFNNITLVENTLAVAGSLIIQPQYLEAGNFFFVTQNFELPDYTQFGITQSFIYVSAAELAAVRSAPSSPIITASYFNPIAALPPRFSPTGYVLA